MLEIAGVLMPLDNNSGRDYANGTALEALVGDKMAKGKDKKEAITALQNLTKKHRSINVRAITSGFEITVFNQSFAEHTHYDAETLVEAIMKAEKATNK